MVVSDEHPSPNNDPAPVVAGTVDGAVVPANNDVVEVTTGEGTPNSGAADGADEANSPPATAEAALLVVAGAAPVNREHSGKNPSRYVDYQLQKRINKVIQTNRIVQWRDQTQIAQSILKIQIRRSLCTLRNLSASYYLVLSVL